MPTPLQPERNPNRGIKLWNVREIWTGPTGQGSYIPNVDDPVIDWSVSQLFRVTAVSSTGYSQLDPVNLNSSGGYTGEDFTRSTGPVQTSDAYRLFCNNKRVPFTMAIDGRLYSVHPDASHFKVFRGSNIGSDGNVISVVYDANGTALTDNVAMDEIGPLGTSDYRKIYREAHLTEALPTGETVTVVVYSVTGSVLSHFGLYVENTNFVRTTSLNRRLVTGIELISSFISVNDNTLIEYPVNLTTQAAMFRARVHYNDGVPSAPLPIDGTRFSLFGLNSFLPTVPDQTRRAVLSYRLGTNEFSNALTGATGDRTISRSYRLTTIDANGVYSVKLYVVPVWTNAPVPKYSLRYYMYNMSRDVLYDVTDKVSVVYGTDAFDGTVYNVEQRVQVTVNIQDVIPTLPYYIHSQIMLITLRSAGGSGFSSNYLSVDYSDGSVYGTGLSARLNGDTMFIDNGYTELGEWLRVHYDSLNPLRYQLIEFEAPRPTHVRLKVGNEFYRVVPIESVTTAIQSVQIPNPQGKTLEMEYVRREGNADTELAKGFLIIRDI